VHYLDNKAIDIVDAWYNHEDNQNCFRLLRNYMLYHIIDALMLVYMGNLHGNLRISWIILPSLCCRIWSLRLCLYNFHVEWFQVSAAK